MYASKWPYGLMAAAVGAVAVGELWQRLLPPWEIEWSVQWVGAAVVLAAIVAGAVLYARRVLRCPDVRPIAVSTVRWALVIAAAVSLFRAVFECRNWWGPITSALDSGVKLTDIIGLWIVGSHLSAALVFSVAALIARRREDEGVPRKQALVVVASSIFLVMVAHVAARGLATNGIGGVLAGLCIGVLVAVPLAVRAHFVWVSFGAAGLVVMAIALPQLFGLVLPGALESVPPGQFWQRFGTAAGLYAWPSLWHTLALVGLYCVLVSGVSRWRARKLAA